MTNDNWSMLKPLVITFIALSLAPFSRADDWPQWMGPGRDNVWHETGIIDKFPATGAKVLWRVPVGAGYSSPTVAGGKVFILDRFLRTGATRPSDPFQRLSIPGVERLVCLNEADGKTIWI